MSKQLIDFYKKTSEDKVSPKIQKKGSGKNKKKTGTGSKEIPKKSRQAKVSDTGKGPSKQKMMGKGDFKDLPTLDAEGIDKLKKEMSENPEELLNWAQKSIDSKITLDQLKNIIYQAEMRIKKPEYAVKELRSTMRMMRSANKLPSTFNFPGMDLNKIPIDTSMTKFETWGDAIGWLIFSGPSYLFPKSKASFRRHDDVRYSENNFIYNLEEPADGKELEVALFSDFGTGYYHSRYIAKQLEESKYPYAFHLGDVYYSGRESEFKENFEEPLDPVLDNTCLFTLNSNHEMFSGAVPYYKYLDKKLRWKNQMQKGSYFCLRSDKIQFVGIDTDYYAESRYNNLELKGWLRDRLNEGRVKNLINILLSSNEPYEYGNTDLTDLFTKDLKDILVRNKLVDLWFWGNTHYCALFDRSPDFPFIGSCIGHGGYPYDRQVPNLYSPAPVKFLETNSRFYKWKGIREDRGNNGFCKLKFKKDGAIEIIYLDWMRNLRCNATFALNQNKELIITQCQSYFSD